MTDFKALAMKYGLPAGIGAVVGYLFATQDPLSIQSQNPPRFVQNLYANPVQMAVLFAVVAVIVIYLYDKNKSGTIYSAGTYDSLLPTSEYYGTYAADPLGSSNAVRFNNALDA